MFFVHSHHFGIRYKVFAFFLLQSREQSFISKTMQRQVSPFNFSFYSNGDHVTRLVFHPLIFFLPDISTIGKVLQLKRR